MAWKGEELGGLRTRESSHESKPQWISLENDKRDFQSEYQKQTDKQTNRQTQAYLALAGL
jgi:hypothetical protein